MALEYLQRIGVDPTQGIACIVLTHWHDDHVEGAARLVAACPDAKLFFSAALRSREFLALAQADLQAQATPSGIQEMERIVKMRFQKGTRRPTFISEGHCFWRSSAPGNQGASIYALSPSGAAVTEALAALGKLLPTPMRPRLRITEPRPNDAAVVLRVDVGAHRILLGADLENVPSTQRGWKAVLASNLHPEGTASVFKVAHHGSSTGEHPGIWTQLLAADPLSILTPFRRLKTPLPRATDEARIRQNSARAFCTARAQATVPRRREPFVERWANRGATNRRLRLGTMGHIRIRAHLQSAGPATVELDGDAYRL